MFSRNISSYGYRVLDRQDAKTSYGVVWLHAEVCQWSLSIRATARAAAAGCRSRVATATAAALYCTGYTLPMRDLDLDDAVHALDFPYSVPSQETRAAIRAALAVLDGDYTVTVTH